MLDPQVGDLLYPSPGVVEEQQRRAVSESKAPSPEQVAEEQLDLVTFEEAGLGWAERFIGIAATRWHTPSISGALLAM
jgi:hypothetical protein